MASHAVVLETLPPPPWWTKLHGTRWEQEGEYATY